MDWEKLSTAIVLVGIGYILYKDMKIKERKSKTKLELRVKRIAYFEKYHNITIPRPLFWFDLDSEEKRYNEREYWEDYIYYLVIHSKSYDEFYKDYIKHVESHLKLPERKNGNEYFLDECKKALKK